MQQRMFDLLGIGEEETEEKFGFLLQAFRYGAPPHGGSCFRLGSTGYDTDQGEKSEDVIAFPKNQRAQSMMDDAPSVVEPEQLDELHIKLKRIQS